jgi:thiol-disulfide isomerase/thioredoxin
MAQRIIILNHVDIFAWNSIRASQLHELYRDRMWLSREQIVRLCAAFVLIALAGSGVYAANRFGQRADVAPTVAAVGLRMPELEVLTEANVASTLSREVEPRATVVVFHSPECGVCELMLPALQPFPAQLRLLMVDVSGKTHPVGTVPANGIRRLSADKATVQRLFPFSGLPTIVFLDSAATIHSGLAGNQPKGKIQSSLKAFALNGR